MLLSGPGSSFDSYAAAVGGAMVERARGREAKRAGVQALDGELGHAPTVGLGRRLAIGAAFAHHVDAQRGVRHLGRDIDVVASLGDGIEIVGEAVARFHGRPAVVTTSGISSTSSIRLISMSR